MTLQLSQNILQKRVFKEKILDLHIKDFMLGQTRNAMKSSKILEMALRFNDTKVWVR